MLNYILRRTSYSVLVIIGVVMMTFVLFQLGAGDPAAAALGKDARPQEIDSLRRKLGGDLPLFFGHCCRSEAFRWQNSENGVRFQRNFDSEELLCRMKSSRKNYEFKIESGKEEFFAELSPGEKVLKIEVFRYQSNPFNSRFLRTFGEIVSFSSEFPYISFFNFGETISTGEPIKDILKRCILPSLALMLPVFAGEIFFGIVFALIAVAFRNTFADRLLVLLSVSGMSVSYLVVIILSQWFLGYTLDLFPLWGFESVKHLFLPVIVGILCGVGANVRFFRTVFSDELKKEYLRTAVAKGAAPVKVYGCHLLRNAGIQIITRASAGLPFLFTGSLLLESFFGIPGLGFAGVDALYNSDIQLLKAIVVLSAFLFVTVNLLADLAYAWADPRIRLE
ncbi:MAG: ABC transporter permease [Lentisphaeria bacterium]|nr:ABC transporter permease [Lentisphaeria bacterium]